MGTTVLRLIADQPGVRLDRWLTDQLADRSRSEIQRWIAEGRVTVDGRDVKASQKLAPGQVVVVEIPPPEPAEIQPEPIPLDIVYEDDDLLVVNKPAGMVVHPGPGNVHISGTLVNAVLAHVPDLEVGGQRRPGIVHRLDKDTSGLIIVAKHDRALRHLQAQFKARRVEKIYLALVEGGVQATRGRIEAPIGRDPRHRQRMAVVTDGSGRDAVTEFVVRERFEGYTLVEALPKTGRTHQIRVHMAYIGHPLVGDAVYGRRRQRLSCDRQMLHAWRLAFRLPSNGEKISLEAPMPEDFERMLDALRRYKTGTRPT